MSTSSMGTRQALISTPRDLDRCGENRPRLCDAPDPKVRIPAIAVGLH